MPCDALPYGVVPCYFFLTNFSINGTIVNRTVISGRGQEAPLHNGDIISVARWVTSEDGSTVSMPFLEFRFDLTGSILADAESPAEATAAAAGGSTPLLRQQHPNAASPSAAAGLAALDKATSPTACSSEPRPLLCGNAVHGGTSFCGPHLRPAFVLEVGGTAVRSGVSADLRRIVHGPVGTDPAEEAPCQPLALGLDLQPGFWQQLLSEQALESLAGRRLTVDAVPVEVCEGTEGASSSSRKFRVRNKSDCGTIQIGNLEASERQDLEQDQQCDLRHGDSIFVSNSRGSTLWLSFRDLSAGVPVRRVSSSSFLLTRRSLSSLPNGPG